MNENSANFEVQSKENLKSSLQPKIKSKKKHTNQAVVRTKELELTFPSPQNKSKTKKIGSKSQRGPRMALKGTVTAYSKLVDCHQNGNNKRIKTATVNVFESNSQNMRSDTKFNRIDTQNTVNSLSEENDERRKNDELQYISKQKSDDEKCSISHENLENHSN